MLRRAKEMVKASGLDHRAFRPECMQLKDILMRQCEGQDVAIEIEEIITKVQKLHRRRILNDKTIVTGKECQEESNFN